ncbi:MAG: substrate-binding domain-containing protein [Candidatus Bruticola sp.]
MGTEVQKEDSSAPGSAQYSEDGFFFEPDEKKNEPDVASSQETCKSLISMEEAMEKWLGAFYFSCSAETRGSAGIESVPLHEAKGRVCAEPVIALCSVPNVFSAAVNGLAVNSASLLGASQAEPRRFTLGKDCSLISTGDSMPESYDIVLPLNEVEFSDNVALVNHVPEPWKNVRPIGEDVEKGSVLVPAGLKISSSDISVMMIGGINRVSVYRKPKIAVINVVQHSVSGTAASGGGKIVNGTGAIIAGLLTEEGAESQCVSLVIENNLEHAEEEIKRVTAQSDGVILISEPEECMSEILNILGANGQLLAQDIALNPGRRVALFKLLGKPLTAVPCFPASAYAGFSVFMLPLIRFMLGGVDEPSVLEWAKLAVNIDSDPNIKDFTFVKLALIDNQRVAVPNPHNILMRCFASADGYVLSPQGESGFKAGSNVLVKRIRPLRSIERNIVVMGSQDVCCSLLSKHCMLKRPAINLIWKDLSSRLSASKLKEKFCHMAAVHIFDSLSGLYNIPFLRENFADFPVVLFGLYRRSLGFVVAPGNPLDINTLGDLTRREVRFVNRQPGAGTRKLFDWNLSREHIEPSSINGYDYCLNNHLASAAEVAAGRADVGLSIPAAAKAMGLTFVPYWLECLDLAVPTSSLSVPAVRDFIEVLRSQEFRAESSQVLQFYDFSCSGEVLWSNVSV